MTTDQSRQIMPLPIFDPHNFYMEGYSAHRLMSQDANFFAQQMASTPTDDIGVQYLRDVTEMILKQDQLDFLHRAYHFDVNHIDVIDESAEDGQVFDQWKWPGVYGNDATLIAFFSTQRRWSAEWGNIFQIGRRESIAHNRISGSPLVCEDVNHLWNFTPNHRSFILLNHSDPFTVQRITAPQADVDLKMLVAPFSMVNKKTPDEISKVIFLDDEHEQVI